MSILGNLAVRSGKRVVWDAKNLRCKSPESANEYITKPYRIY
jgi:hypothetical protein